jgi:hypothetical protein
VGAAGRIARRLRQRRGLDSADQSSGLFQPGPASTDAPLIGGLALGQRLTNGDDLIIEASLFQSGRPTLVVPCIQKAPLKLDRVLVAWDGSHGAARAIGDAMPFLRRAKTIDIVTAFVRLGIRSFNSKLKTAAARLETLRSRAKCRKLTVAPPEAPA